jgi:hypothetical protein
MVRPMKIKSHVSKWAMALCALAVFSFTAHAGVISVDPSPIVAAGTETATSPKISIDPVPPMPPVVEVGTFNGTVMD